MTQYRVFLAVLFTVLIVSTGLAAAAFNDDGTMIVFLGDEQIGTEEFSFTDEGLSTTGNFSFGGQKLSISTVLSGRLGHWDSYKYQSMGVRLEGTLAPEHFKITVGPLEQSFALSGSYALLDNNVFAQYQELIYLADTQQDQHSSR